MNPKSIGNKETDAPQANADDETLMIYQEFISDPEAKVEEVLEEGNVNVSFQQLLLIYAVLNQTLAMAFLIFL